MQKRIAIFVPDMSGGGTEQVVLRLLQHFVARGVAADLVVMQASGELMPLVPQQVRIVELAASRIRHAIRPLARYLEQERPDALLAQMWPITVVAVLVGRLTRTSTRIVTADHSTLSQQYGGSGRLGDAVLRRTIGLSYPRAHARVAVSKGVAHDLAMLGDLAESSIEVIYNPVQPPPARPAPDPAIEELWGIGRGGRILSVGKLKEEKQQAVLIRSFARVAARRDCRLMIVGAGPLQGELEQLARTEGVGDKVILPGFTTDPWPYFFSADVFALTSRFEGLGIVLIEAMHAGLRIVSTDCKNGPREVLDGGRYGTLVPVGDVAAIAAALEDALDLPEPPPGMAERVRALHGADTLARYEEILLGHSPVVGRGPSP